MIPKKIHYCWFGKAPLTEEAKKCINSWKKFMPDYEIIRWDESNFDIGFCNYTQQAYECKKWAFVSDVARFYILYNHGGIYFDTDVELIKSLEPILLKGGFMGAENFVDKIAEGQSQKIAIAPGLGLAVNPGLGLAVNPGLGLYKEILSYYENVDFLDKTGKFNNKTIVHITTEILKKHGLKDINEIQKIDQISIYPNEYFCPLDQDTGKLVITDNTYSIHWYSASWQSNYSKIKTKIKRLLGPRISQHIMKLKKHLKEI